MMATFLVIMTLGNLATLLFSLDHVSRIISAIAAASCGTALILGSIT